MLRCRAEGLPASWKSRAGSTQTSELPVQLGKTCFKEPELGEAVPHAQSDSPSQCGRADGHSLYEYFSSTLRTRQSLLPPPVTVNLLELC